MSDSQTTSGAILERPREVHEYPLLDWIYARHDALVSRYVADGLLLELAFGTHPHPDTDIAIDAFPENTRAAPDVRTLTADARELPIRANTVGTVVGRRFLHHVPEGDRVAILDEVARVLAPGGRLVLLEGTPGLYRRATKRLAFRLGALGEDTDEYGHLTPRDLHELVAGNGFEIVTERALGSPLMPLSIVRSERARTLADVYERTQWVRWWTLVVAEVL